MKKSSQIAAHVLMLLVVSAASDNTVRCQEKSKDTMVAKTFGLAQGCTLVLDARIDTTDSLAVQVISGIRELMPRIQKLIPADSVTIALAISKENILPQFGMGGGSSNDRVDFSFDPQNPNFRVDFMLRSLAHELQHVVRLRMPQWHLTLLECMITEGLSDHFMIEVFNCEMPAWSHAITEDEIEHCMVLVKPVLRIQHQSWDAEFNEKYFVPWMFGRKGDNPIPGWTGYTLGWRIVDNYLKAHPGVLASSLVWTPAEVIVRATPQLSESD